MSYKKNFSKWWIGIASSPVVGGIGLVLDILGIIDLGTGAGSKWFLAAIIGIFFVSVMGVLAKHGIGISMPGLSKMRLFDLEKVKVGRYLERDWHNRKLKVTLKDIKQLEIKAPVLAKIEGESGSYSVLAGEDKSVIVAELDVFWGHSPMHTAENVVRTQDGHFLVPQAVEENEDQSSVFVFWNTKRAFWFLSVWVSHISEQEKFADISFSIVVLEW